MEENSPGERESWFPWVKGSLVSCREMGKKGQLVRHCVERCGKKGVKTGLRPFGKKVVTPSPQCRLGNEQVSRSV